MAVKDPKKLRKRILMILFIIFNIVVIAWTAFREFSGQQVDFHVQVRWWMLWGALGCFVFAIVCEITKYYLLILKRTGRKEWKLAAEVVLIGKYYDNITPAAVGGQPFQIYYLNKHKISNSDSAAIPLSCFVFMQFAFVLIALFLFIFWGSKIDVVRISGWIGLCLYAFFPLLILASVFFPQRTSKMIIGGANFLHRIHLLKNQEKAKEWLEKNIDSYANGVREVLRDKKGVVILMILSIGYQVGMCFIPFFVIHAFGGNLGGLTSLMTTVAILAAISFIPTPGNAGAAEGSFYLVFSALSGGYTFWAMLTWRFFSYYLFIILGVSIFASKYLKARKLKKMDGAENVNGGFEEWKQQKIESIEEELEEKNTTS